MRLSAPRARKLGLRAAARVARWLAARAPYLRNRHFLIIDVLALCLSPAAALLLRLDGEAYQVLAYIHALLIYTLLSLCIRVPVFRSFGLYNQYWRTATVDELLRTSAAVLASTALVGFTYVATSLLARSPHPLPDSLPIIEGMLVLGAVGMTRFSMRVATRLLRPVAQDGARRTLVLGAGGAGRSVVEELAAHPELGLFPVAFLDDDPAKQGTRILNRPVVGSLTDLPKVALRWDIGQVIIAMPTAAGRVIRECLTLCEKADVPAKTVPSMHEILRGSVRVSHLRNVEIQDLLRREPIRADITAVREVVEGRRVLVTGGGGSIGSELCRQVLRCAPAELVILGHGENSVFEIHNELQQLVGLGAVSSNGNGAHAHAPVLHPVIADIRSPERITNVVREFRPEIIFHAAAHKHVPLMEMHPGEAVINNILGTRNLLDAALKFGVERFVMISSDKAVNPTSVMGASKRAAEMLVLEAARKSGRAYVAVRFGNVLGSRGSVVLTFKRQIAEGGPVTVSHPEMTRFFMTIPEAVQLVLEAGALGKGGEVFMLDMGQPIRIADLARDLIELSGLELGRDIDIRYTEIRPGEKLFEELFVVGEQYEPTRHEKVLIARNAAACVPPVLHEAVARLERAASEDDREGILSILQELILEYHPGASTSSPNGLRGIPEEVGVRAPGR